MKSIKDMVKRRVFKSFEELKWYEWAMCGIMIAVAIYSMVMSFIGASSNPIWLSIVNFISAICGVICVFLTAKASISNFSFAVLNTISYIVFLAYWKIYGTLALEIIVYFPMNIISWMIWAKHRDEELDHLTKSKKMNAVQNVLTTIGIIAISVLAHYLMQSLAGDSWGRIGDKYGTRNLLTWLDSFTFAIGIVAIFLEAFRYREQYVWWLVTDVVAVVFYAIRVPFDPVYMVKKTIYLVMAIIGLKEWIRLQKQRNEENE